MFRRLGLPTYHGEAVLGLQIFHRVAAQNRDFGLGTLLLALVHSSIHAAVGENGAERAFQNH